MPTPTAATTALIVRAVVTLVLVGLAFLAPEVDAEIRAVIVGAVVGYWLREGEGRALTHRTTTRLVGAHRARGTGSTTTTTDPVAVDHDDADHPHTHPYED